MAGDWIKIEHALPDKPEVWRISTLLDMTPEQVVGHLLRVWSWFDIQSRDGNADSVTDASLDAIARHDGFAQAMRTAGWLTSENGALHIPNFERHNGKTAKQRALTNRRQQMFRVTHASRDRNAPSVTREEKSIYNPYPSRKAREGNGSPPSAGPAGLKKKRTSKTTPRQRGTNPRAQGTNPRALGANPRAQRNGSGVLSDNAIIALGIKLGVPARAGEEMNAYRARVMAEERRRDDG
jgi:hypothetical protein